MCYDVYLYGDKLTTIEAYNEVEAFEKAVKLYGLEIDIKEITCKHQMSYN